MEFIVSELEREPIDFDLELGTPPSPRLFFAAKVGCQKSLLCCGDCQGGR